MDVLTWLSLALISAGALAYVLLPLLRYRHGPGRLTAAMGAAQRMVAGVTESQTDGGLPGLALRRDGLCAAMQDMRYDFETGKLSAADYVAGRQRLVGQAAVILAQMDALRPSRLAPTVDEEIEHAVSERRRIGSHETETASTE